MLSKVTIDGFKSVRGRTELRLAPLTILTGTNSAGKSTVLQTLLLHAQTLQSSVHAGSVVLNGHIEQLGRFSDIATSGPQERPISLGFDLDVDSDGTLLDDTMLARSWWSPLSIGTRWDNRGLELATVHCEYSFSRGRPTKRNQMLELEPLLLATTLSAGFRTGSGAESVSITAERSRSKVDTRARRLGLDAEHFESYRRELEYEVKQEHGGKWGRSPELYGESYVANEKARGVRLSHFIPEGKFVTYGESNRVAWSFLWDLITGTYTRYHGSTRLRSRPEPDVDSSAARIVAGALLRLVVHLSVYSGAHERSSASVSDLLKVVSSVPAASMDEIGKAISKLDPDAQRNFLRSLRSQAPALLKSVSSVSADPVLGNVVPINGPISAASSYAQRFFRDRIKYIGPLREEPRAVYPISGSAINPRDVGIRGENAAAVLYNFGEVRVSNVRAQQLLTCLDKPGIETMPLREAVTDWLGYLSIADKIGTNDRGTEGYEVLVTPPGAHESHGMSHVGVGVSQVLPLVVQSLLAERGTVLLFEQPELHLHPRVQSRLADFFYAMTVLGKQCIVETHSEYLVNRLRYLRALAPGEALSSSVLLYFVSMTEVGSRFDEVAIDKYGRISEWPEGFFDESERLACDIVEASVDKASKASKASKAK